MLRRKPIVKNCEITSTEFEISPEQKEAYDYFDLPLPNISSVERLRHQLSFCSDHQLFWRRCASTSRRVISAYATNSLFPVVDIEYWRSEDWNPFEYGRAYDFDELFVDQLLRLWQEVPRPSLNLLNCSGSADCHDAIELEQCSMVFNSAYSQRCFHSSHLYHCSDCSDCHSISNSEWCYECTYAEGCSRVFWSNDVENCADSYFLSNCTDCVDCLFCTNLSNAQYVVFNEQLDKESYERVLEQWSFSSNEQVILAKRTYHTFLQEHAIPHIASDDPETTSGNYLRKSKRTTNSFECYNCNNCIDCNLLFDSDNCLDCCGTGIETEFCAQSVGVGYRAKRVVNSIDCWDNVEDLEYCSNCENSRHLFACIGLRNAEYCILNNQYSKDEYFSIRLSIVALLKERDIWGRFLPASFSAYEYNHSLAQIIMPLVKVPALLLGFRWDSSDPLVRPSQLKSRMGTELHLANMPSRVDALDSQSASREVFLCELSGKPYTLSAQEREFYKELKIAPPHTCPEKRYEDKIKNMSPRIVEDRDGMNTSFPADWFRPVLPYSEWKQRVLAKRK